MRFLFQKKQGLIYGAMMVLVFFQSVAMAATVVRGPYLQMGDSDSMVVRWRTDRCCNR